MNCGRVLEKPHCGVGATLCVQQPLLSPRVLMVRVFTALGATIAIVVSAAGAPPVTFTHDVAPILYKRCVPCHRSDGDAPFSLTSFDDARRHASQIVAATRSRYMPPWKPEREGGPFVGDRRLTDGELNVL